jgi:hypothetical protein
MKTKPTKKTEAKFKSVIVVQKDRPLQELISEAADRYLKELVMNYQDFFTADGYSKAVRTTGTMLLHGKFYEMCRRHTDLDGTLRALRKAQSMSMMTLTDVGQIETMFVSCSFQNWNFCSEQNWKVGIQSTRAVGEQDSREFLLVRALLEHRDSPVEVFAEDSPCSRGALGGE